MSRAMLVTARVNPVLRHPEEHSVSLDGAWGFRLDPEDRGVAERWHGAAPLFGETIQVPGSWQGQGFGGDAKETIWDFRLEVRTFRATYRGTGWYAREVRAPAEWQGRRLWLRFGGVHPSAEVWLDGVRLGANDAPFVPFGFEVTDLLRPGTPSLVVVRVHEAARDLGLAYNWQGCWSGLYRGVELAATGPACLASVLLHPDVDAQVLRIRAQVGGLEGLSAPAVLAVTAGPIGGGGQTCAGEWPVAAEVNVELPVPSPRPWSPDAPNLYRVDVALRCGDTVLDARSERVGFVKLSTEGKHFLINGEPYYLRGSGDFLSNPETGCPDTDRDRWRRKLAVLRDYGYNYVRCQSYVPSPEYLDAADEVGLLVQSEMGALGAWGGHTAWHGYAWPPPDPRYREAILAQWNQVVLRDVSHPSANLYCMSNELGSGTHFPRVAWRCYHDTKALKPSAMVIWTDGGWNPDLPGDFVNAEASLDGQCEKPVIQHEFRWWSSFPDVRLAGKYSGAVRPYGAEIALEAAARHGIAHVLPQAAANSQRLQLIEAKVQMEACRRNHPRLAGICHFNAMDANPSPQGIIDEFYERKYADAATWRQTNGDTVVLAGLGFDDRVLAAGGVLRCALSVSDFSHPPLQAPSLEWQLLRGEDVLASGRIAYEHTAYRTCPAGEVEARLPETVVPSKLALQVALREGARAFTNRWDFWILPHQDLPAGVRVHGTPRHTWLRGWVGGTPGQAEGLQNARIVLAEELDEALVAFMRAGGRVVLAASEGLVRPFAPKLGQGSGHYFFTPPANYPPYEDGHDGTIILQHPMLGDFPHEGLADLQCFRMVGTSPAIDLESLGLTGTDPVIRAIHSYPVCHPLGYLVEAACGEGGLVICALKLDHTWPEARYLLARICEYAAGEAFRPAMRLTGGCLDRLASATRE